MTLADLGDRYAEFYAPRFVLHLDGEVYKQTEGLISDVSVDGAAEKADRFSFTLTGVYDEDDGALSGLDWDRFRPETPVKIDMGYGSETETLLVGSIAEHRPDFPQRGDPTVEVSGYGIMHELQNGSKSRSWDDTTDADVAEEVANDYRFDVVAVTETQTQRPKIAQDDETDLAFLERLAGRNSTDAGSFQVTVRRDEFRFGPAPSNEEPTVTLAYGDALQSFSPEYRTGSQVERVEVRGYDAGQASGVVGTAESDGPGSGTEEVREPVRSEAEAEQAARARLGDIEDDRLSGRGESIGLPEIRAGKPLELTRLGERFSKKYYVETATHRVGSDGYSTSFQVRLAEGEDVA